MVKRYRLDRPELLAPAGSLEKLKFAIHYGADAVYIGGQQYGLRSNADNFSFDQMAEGVAFAKPYGAKVFVATNIYAHNTDLPGIKKYLQKLEEVGIDAIIAADPIIIETAQQYAPKLEVHLSTQQSTINYKSVEYWKKQGLPRVVLGREASLQEIIEMKEHLDVEIEAFIHGAMCSSISGRCVLSNHFTDRDSNRGGCCQSCRWQYQLHQKDGSLIASENEFHFTMGSKDMCMIEHIPALIEAGIDSFKIEGRMKSLHYVATVVHAYRQAIDAYFKDPLNYRLDPKWKTEIDKAANRPLNPGFFFAEPSTKDHIYYAEEKGAPYDFAGVVLDYDEKEKVAKIQQRSHFSVGQKVEFFGPEGNNFVQEVSELKDDKFEMIDKARHPLKTVYMKVQKPVKPLDLLRKNLHHTSSHHHSYA